MEKKLQNRNKPRKQYRVAKTNLKSQPSKNKVAGNANEPNTKMHTGKEEVQTLVYNGQVATPIPEREEELQTISPESETTTRNCKSK